MKNVLRNAWYVAAWAHELKGDSIFPRRLLDEPIALFRDKQGVAHALFDRCPHRFAPLSMGKLCNGGTAIECRYHGLRYDSTGQCVLNPHGDGKIPKAAVVKSYPLVERYCALWIWMGDPDKADPATIPVFEFMEKDQFAIGMDYLVVNGQYELENDNILDLSHIEFMHPLFASDGVRRSKMECVQDGDTVWSKRLITDDDAPEFIRNAFGLPIGPPVDRWLDVRWNAPGSMALYTGAVLSGTPRETATILPTAHWFTPETEKSTHYFYSVCIPRSIGPEADKIASDSIQAFREPFEHEDKPMIEAVADRMGDAEFWSLKPILLPADAPAVRARRVLQKLIAAESETQQAAGVTAR